MPEFRPWRSALEPGGGQPAEVLGVDPFNVVKTLVTQDVKGSPLIVLMHGNRTVCTKNLAPHRAAVSAR